MARKFTKQQIAEWTEELRRELKPGDVIHTLVRCVAASGMSRHIDVYRFVVEDGRIRKYWLSPRVAAICGFTFDEKKECIRIGGCGMDMGHHIVYSLSQRLFPDGFAPGSSREGFKGGTTHYKVLATRPADGKIVDVNMGRGINAGPMSKAEIESLRNKGFVFKGGRNGDQSGWDNDGGYALVQEWI